MSGGHYDYKYFQIEQLADDIEREFLEDGNYKGEDWSTVDAFGKHSIIDIDRISDATDEERPIILKEVKSLIEDLRKCSIRAKELEWYLSGDTGATSYLERLRDKKIL